MLTDSKPRINRRTRLVVIMVIVRACLQAVVARNTWVDSCWLAGLVRSCVDVCVVGRQGGMEGELQAVKAPAYARMGL